MTEIIQASVFITSQADVIRARTIARELARSHGFKTADQIRLATAMSELARNALDYVGTGVCTISTITEHGKPAIRIMVSDEGPGIPDQAQRPDPGLSAGRGPGKGLPNVRRLIGNLTIDSRPGRTVIEATMRWRG